MAAVLWLPALLVMLRSGRIDRRIWIAAIFPSVVNTVAQTTWAWGLYFLDPAIVAFSAQINAVWANVLAMWLFRDERGLLRQSLFWLGTLASSTGFLLMVGGHPNLWSHDTLVGMAILLAGSIPWGLYPVSVRRNMSKYPPVAAFAVIALYTAIACDVLMLGFGEPRAMFSVSWQVLGWVVLSAILGIGVAHVLYYAALNRLGVAVTAGILLLNPFLTAVLSAVFWGERLRPVQWIGGVGLVAGTAFLVYAKQRLGRPAQEKGISRGVSGLLFDRWVGGLPSDATSGVIPAQPLKELECGDKSISSCFRNNALAGQSPMAPNAGGFLKQPLRSQCASGVGDL